MSKIASKILKNPNQAEGGESNKKSNQEIK